MPQVFYDMKARKKVSIPDAKCKSKKLSNGRWQLTATSSTGTKRQLTATSSTGTKLFKFVTEAVGKKYK